MERLLERVSLLPDQVGEIINRDLGIVVGCGVKKKKHRHFLFYSPRDAQCFVAIQDECDGVIITVLPIDYHESSAFYITEEAQIMAKDILLKFLRNLQRA